MCGVVGGVSAGCSSRGMAVWLTACVAECVRNHRTPTRTHNTHRCKHGKGSWNWRMKFRVDLPHKHPLLHIQLWDKDLLSYNDCLAETVLDLSRAMRIAYATKSSYGLYRKKSDAIAARQARAKAKKAEAKRLRRRRRKKRGSSRKRPTPVVRRKYHDRLAPSAGGGAVGASTPLLAADALSSSDARRLRQRGAGVGGRGGDSEEEESDESGDDSEADREEARLAKEKKRKAAEEKKEQASDFVAQFKALVGLGAVRGVCIGGCSCVCVCVCVCVCAGYACVRRGCMHMLVVVGAHRCAWFGCNSYRWIVSGLT